MSKTRRNSERQTVMQQGQCRIIAGRWRGRKVTFNDAEGLRPTTDRIRETVFNWLHAYLPNSDCLDCFAGSGVLGFEALSRGARQVIFIERNKTSVTKLKENAQSLHADNAVIVNDDALEWLQKKRQSVVRTSAVRPEKKPDNTDDPVTAGQKFDLVFLDPPYHANLLQQTSELLNSSGCLAEDALIYAEHSVDETIKLPDNWTCIKQKRAGQVVYQLFQYQK